MTLRFYILDKHRVIQTNDVLEWVECMESRERIVARTEFACGVLVSTVFLGLDHRFGRKGPPLVFETMVFELAESGSSDEQRYSSWDDAETGHKAVVRRVKAQIKKAGQLAKEEQAL
jgi:hypothetical protein